MKAFVNYTFIMCCIVLYVLHAEYICVCAFKGLSDKWVSKQLRGTGVENSLTQFLETKLGKNGKFICGTEQVLIQNIRDSSRLVSRFVSD